MMIATLAARWGGEGGGGGSTPNLKPQCLDPHLNSRSDFPRKLTWISRTEAPSFDGVRGNRSGACRGLVFSSGFRDGP